MSNTIELKFRFNNLNLLKAKKIIKKYPKKFSRSAILPFLHLAQEQIGGWLNKPAIEYISKYLKIPLINVYEVATFYHMFNLKKVGKNLSINAIADDGIIEGIESDSHKFFLGIQWHPEFFISNYDKKIFKAFIKACQK